MPSTAAQLTRLYDTLREFFGPQDWWPAETPFEVAVGAILAQNTNWQNVIRAIDNLKRAGALDPAALHRLDHQTLGELIKPAGYYNVKAARLKNFITRLHQAHGGRLETLLALEPDELRRELLSVKGIGPETADSIVLYAARKPIFVIDAYTHRILSRLGLCTEDDDYHALQEMFMDNLPEDVAMFNEYHALLVNLGKHYCKPKPRCPECPAVGWPCPAAEELGDAAEP